MSRTPYDAPRRMSFRLDPILRIRNRELERARGALASLLEEAARLERESTSWTDVARAALEQLSTKLADGMRAGLLLLTADSVDRARARAEEASGQLRACEQAIATARQAVVTAKTRVRALELLRERRERDAAILEGRLAQQQLDEIGALMTIRQGGRA